MTENEVTDDVIDWLKNIWVGDKKCTVCKNVSWDISPKFAELREYHQGEVVTGEKVYPLLIVTCKVCGYTHLINAIIAGLIDSDGRATNTKSKPIQSDEKTEKESKS